jgi:DNA-binding CsgD family transcriptional regulator
MTAPPGCGMLQGTGRPPDAGHCRRKSAVPLTTDPAAAALPPLTRRQREVLALLAQGHSNAAIAERLALARTSVERHVSALYRCLGLAPRDGAVHPRVRLARAFLQASLAAAAAGAPAEETRACRERPPAPELRIRVDEAKTARAVAEITRTDYFRALQDRAARLRFRLASAGDELVAAAA